MACEVRGWAIGPAGVARAAALLCPYDGTGMRTASRVTTTSRSASAPRKPAHSVRSGRTSTLMKPIWQLTMVFASGTFGRSIDGGNKSQKVSEGRGEEMW